MPESTESDRRHLESPFDPPEELRLARREDQPGTGAHDPTVQALERATEALAAGEPQEARLLLEVVLEVDPLNRKGRALLAKAEQLLHDADVDRELRYAADWIHDAILDARFGAAASRLESARSRFGERECLLSLASLLEHHVAEARRVAATSETAGQQHGPTAAIAMQSGQLPPDLAARTARPAPRAPAKPGKPTGLDAQRQRKGGIWSKILGRGSDSVPSPNER